MLEKGILLLLLSCFCLQDNEVDAFIHSRVKHHGSPLRLSSSSFKIHEKISSGSCYVEKESGSNPHEEKQTSIVQCSRRSVFSSPIKLLSTTAAFMLVNPLPSKAAVIENPNGIDSTLTSENGLLESRLTENLLSSPTYGLESPDIYYPSYFSGVWNVTSTATEVYAPCGIQLFGGNATYEAAKREIGPEKALRYRARFLPDQLASKPTAIADREFNVREIAKSAMGKNSVQDVSLATPNKFSCLLSPAGAGKLFSVDMISVARRQEDISFLQFDCSEVVRQIISPVNTNGNGGIPTSNPSSASNLKEIETISSYTVKEQPGSGEVTEIKCLQRSASFLLPSQTDPLAYRMWQAAKGRPVDVRFYEVTYSKK